MAGSLKKHAGIGLLEANEHAAWDEYVRAHENGSFFHLAGWQRIFGPILRHRPYYLRLRDGSEVGGVLPLVHMRGWPFGNLLISLPYLATAGALADSATQAERLEDAALDLARDLGVDLLELRGHQRAARPGQVKSGYVNFDKVLDPDPEICLAQIPRKQRAMVRKGIKKGLVSSENADIDRFYAVFSESYRNLGTPVLPKKYFSAIQREFGEQVRVLMVTHDDTDIASVMSFYFRDRVLPYYGGGIAAGRSLQANDFMYWELMRRSCDEGIRVFDYGRSRENTGSYDFKRHWGFEPEPLYYECQLVAADQLPDLSPGNSRYQAMIRAWQKLPAWLTRLVGPPIARRLPG